MAACGETPPAKFPKNVELVPYSEPLLVKYFPYDDGTTAEVQFVFEVSSKLKLIVHHLHGETSGRISFRQRKRTIMIPTVAWTVLKKNLPDVYAFFADEPSTELE